MWCHAVTNGFRGSSAFARAAAETPPKRLPEVLPGKAQAGLRELPPRLAMTQLQTEVADGSQPRRGVGEILRSTLWTINSTPGSKT